MIGARTTHYELVHYPQVAEHCGLLAEAAATVADPALRPVARWAAPRACRPGRRPARGGAGAGRHHGGLGPGGEREIAAADFFVDYLTSSLEPDEILTAIRVPKLGSGWGYRYEKFHRTAQAWATVGVAALVRRSNGSGRRGTIVADQHGPDAAAGHGRGKRRSRGGGQPGRAAGRGRPARTRVRIRRATCTVHPTTGGT